MLELLLLGKPNLLLDGRVIKLPTKKALGLVAYLALEGPTSRSWLAELFWGELGDEDARRNLRQELYRFQTRMPKGLFELEVDGEDIALASTVETDVQRFDSLVDSKAFSEALQLYRGLFLDGLEVYSQAFETWLEAKREHLANLYKHALFEQARFLEQAGNLREALELHLKLLEENPILEESHREVMRLRFMLGNRSGALEQYERCKQLLWDELVLEPLPETQRLAEQIRSNLSIPTQLDSATPGNLSLNPPMMGREEVLSALSESLDGLTLITGEPGVGKSRLLEERIKTSGSWLRLQGREEFGKTPFYPVAEVLRNLSELQKERITNLEPIWRLELARLVPELSPDPQKALEVEPPSPEGRPRFFEALSRALLAAVGKQGVILLDDLHWFDPMGLELLGHLVRRAKEDHIRVVAAARSVELEQNPGSGSLLEGLERDGLLRQINLEPLNEGVVRGLIQALSGGGDAPVFARRLHAATGGNPLFIMETLLNLFASGELKVGSDGVWATSYDLETQDYSELPIPPSVREVVIDRADQLGAATRRMLDVASLAGDDFGLELISSATALNDWEGVEALERAVEARLILPTAQAHRFSHDLIRRSLSDSLSKERRKLIHRKLASGLEGMGGAPGRIAEHYEKGEQKSKAGLWRIKAAEAATKVYAYQSALEHYEKALEDGIVDEFLIYRERVNLWRFLDNRAGWGRDAQKMLEVATEQNNDARRAAALVELAECSFRLGESTEAFSLAEGALKYNGIEPSTFLEAHLIASLILSNLGRYADAEERLMNALAVVSNAPSPITARVWYALANHAFGKGDVVAAKIHNQRVYDLAKKNGDKINLIRSLLLSGEFADLEGDKVTAIGLSRESLEVARQIGHISFQCSTLMHLAWLYLSDGRVDLALPLIAQGLKLTSYPDEPIIKATFLMMQADCDLFLGNIASAIASMDAAISIVDQCQRHYDQISYRLTRAQLFVQLGNTKLAQNFLQEIADFQLRYQVHNMNSWIEAIKARIEFDQRQFHLAISRVQAAIPNFDSFADGRDDAICLLATIYNVLDQPEEAFSIVEAVKITSPGVEAQVLAIQLESLSQLGHDISETLGMIRRLLQSDRLTPLQSLHLSWAGMKTLQTTQFANNLNYLRKQGEEIREKLINKMPTELQSAFLIHFGNEGKTSLLTS